MASCEDVVAKAMRKAGVLGELHDPTAYDMISGLDALQGLYHGWIASGMFGRAIDVMADGNYTASENQRIRRNGVTAGTITVPDTFEDEDNGGQRSPRNRAFVIYADALVGTDVTLFYDAYAGGWTQVSDLLLATVAPLSNIGDGLACCLAEVIADERGGGVGPSTQRTAARFRSSLALNFDSPRPASVTEYY